MKIMIVGVSCVGKSTVGKLLADRLGYRFFDFDFEVEAFFDSHITFLKRKYLTERIYRENASVVLAKILRENSDDFVIAMPPSGLMDSYWRIIRKDNQLITVALKDKARNILKRLTFYDDYSRLMEEPVVTKKNEKRYRHDIALDNEYFGVSYRKAKIHLSVEGKTAQQAADELKEMLLKRDNSVCSSEMA